MQASTLFSRIFLGFGLILLVIGSVSLIERLLFVDAAEEGLGIIVQVDEVSNPVTLSDTETGKHYYPAISYTDNSSGEEIVFHSPAGVTGTSYTTGSEVSVLYLPGDSSSAALNTVSGVYGFAIVFAGLGVLFLIFSAVAYRGFDKKNYN